MRARGGKDEGFFSVGRRVGYVKLGDVVNINVDPVEAVADVNLHEEDGAVHWVGEEDFANDYGKGMTELHCLCGHQWESSFVDT